jgi:hypothetical protein
VTEVSVIAHATPDHASTASAATLIITLCIYAPRERKNARNANARPLLSDQASRVKLA